MPSPDGLRIVDVVTEDQGANDPDPIWQHVSIRRPTDLKPVLPGNVMVCSCYSRPEVTWLDNSTVSIVIGGTVGESFRLHPPPKFIETGGISFSVRVSSVTTNDP